jgi:hypothetical protein
VRKVNEGVAQYEGMRSPPVFWPFLRFIQVLSLAVAGRPADALEILDELLAAMGHQTSAIQFHLVQGDLRLALGGAPASVEASYRRSLEMGQRCGAPMIELEAETRLLRLRRALGETDDGTALRAVYDRFTEGFATRDLAEARELLA